MVVSETYKVGFLTRPEVRGVEGDVDLNQNDNQNLIVILTGPLA